MKRFSSSRILLSAFLIAGCAANQALGAKEPAQVKSDLQGLYFGQKPPGLIPEVFAPGIVSISGRHEGVMAFSPDLDEIYFNADNKDQETSIYFSRLEGGKWAPIRKADFTKGKIDEEIHPFVSPDGKRIYFTAISSDLTYNKIWYVNRLKNGWSSAVKLESPVNDDQVFYPNQSADGDLYYFNLSKGKTYYASDNLNGFSQIEPVEIEFGVHAFIAPSQDYLVLNARHKEDENRKDNDIYVSFKRKNGTWAKPINLGDEVNSNSNDKAPTISPDGKYLFFGRDEEDGKANIYWVSTKVIENLRPEMQTEE